MKNSHETATLSRADGDYRAGLAVTTDPARPHDPSGEPPIFVDPQRFAAWTSAGLFGGASPKKGGAARVVPETEPTVAAEPQEEKSDV